MTTDWLPELSDDDLSVLIEALEAWESKDAAGEMLGDLMEGMLLQGDKPAMEQVRAERQIQKLTRSRSAAVRKERSVLLRAKLLTLRERRRVDQAIASAKERT